MRILAVSLAFLVAGCDITALISELESDKLWKKVGAWDIRVDNSIENSCFAYVSWEPNIFLRIGFDMRERDFYFYLGSDDWKSLEYGKEYELKIEFGSKTPWTVAATGKFVGEGEVVFLYASSTDTEFLDQFKKQRNMRISYLGKQIANVDLKKSYAAFTEVINCQNAMMESASSNDPFLTIQPTKPSSSDPFAN